MVIKRPPAELPKDEEPRRRNWLPVPLLMILLVYAIARVWAPHSIPNTERLQNKQQVKSYVPGLTPRQNQPTEGASEATGQGLAASNQPGRAGVQAPPGALQRDVNPDQATQNLQVGVSRNIPGFSQRSLDVKAGEVVSLTFRNDSDPRLNYHHYWVLVNPGTEGRVATEAARAGAQAGGLPHSPDILAQTSMLGPGESQTIYFRAPSKSGDYPYICVFPGHSIPMHGTLHVHPAE